MLVWLLKKPKVIAMRAKFHFYGQFAYPPIVSSVPPLPDVRDKGFPISEEVTLPILEAKCFHFMKTRQNTLLKTQLFDPFSHWQSLERRRI